jgi:L-threonylcarbamoyladenylate synthase
VPDTRVIPVDHNAPEPAAISQAAQVLRAGGLVAFPTETVYGLGADATNPAAVAAIYVAKGRPTTNPLILHGHDVAAVGRAVSTWSKSAILLAERFWPGPLTLVLPRSTLVPDAVTAGLGTVGVRVPDNRVALELLAKVGVPIAAPSANRSTGISPTRAEHVVNDLAGRIDLILDAGPTSVGLESTVLDLSTDPPRLLRPGAITARQLEAALGVSIHVADSGIAHPQESGQAMSSPGQLDVHYAPRTPIVLVEPDHVGPDTWRADQRVALLVFDREAPRDVPAAAVRYDWADPATAGRWLYDTFHQCDRDKLDLIVAVVPPDLDEWRAVRDRLWRASRKWARR